MQQFAKTCATEQLAQFFDKAQPVGRFTQGRVLDAEAFAAEQIRVRTHGSEGENKFVLVVLHVLAGRIVLSHEEQRPLPGPKPGDGEQLVAK
jgi:hypothetical protein